MALSSSRFCICPYLIALLPQRELERYDGDSFSCSLYKGEAGLAVLAADLEVPQQARMPFFEG